MFSTRWCQIERYCDSLQNEGSTTWNGEETVKLWVKNGSWTILSVSVMSQIGILTPDWSVAAVPCYSPDWKIAFGVNDEANKIRICSKITSQNNFLFENVINSSAVVDTTFVNIYVDTKNIPTCRYNIQHIDKRTMKNKIFVNNHVRSCNELCNYF